MAKILQENEFESEVLQSDVPVLVDFFATWCGPCKMLAPIIDQLSEQTEGKAKVFKVDVDQCGAIASRYEVTNIPTVIVFEKGEVKQISVGAKPLPQLKAMLGL